MPYAGQMDWDANGTLQIGDLMPLAFLSSYRVQRLPTRRVIYAMQIPESHSSSRPSISKDKSSFPSSRPIISIPFPNVLKHESQPILPIPNNSYRAQEYSAGILESEYVPTKKIYSASHLVNHILRQKAGTLNLVRIVTFVVRNNPSRPRPSASGIPPRRNPCHPKRIRDSFRTRIRPKPCSRKWTPDPCHMCPNRAYTGRRSRSSPARGWQVGGAAVFGATWVARKRGARRSRQTARSDRASWCV
jgi:hypothetical protein